MTPTEKQLRDVLELKIPGEGRKDYSVMAGAGGGKTTLLSTRIGNQIYEGVPIEDFVIITYTNAAATELREKITNRLQKMLDGGITDAEKRSNVERALGSIELMQISTIHAFLLKILREYAFEAGIVLDARMLEDGEEQERKRKFFDKWYHEKFDEIEAFNVDWKIPTQSGYLLDHTREVFEGMFYALANIREEIVFDSSDHTADIEKAASDYIAKWWPKARNFRYELENQAPIKGNNTCEKVLLKAALDIIGKVDTVVAAVSDGDTSVDVALTLSDGFEIMQEVAKGKKNLYGKKHLSCEAPVVDAIPIKNEPETIWNFREMYEKYMMNAQKAAKVVEYVCDMRKAYQAEIDAETLIISNDEILYRAEKLLAEHKDILDKLRSRYSKIYVDEFQDTTGQQTRIIKLLCEEEGTALEENKLQPDKLLVVGDPKQSIYRFTGAEKAVYDEVNALLGSFPVTHAESVGLDSNFRSNEDIVKWVNKSFGKLMGTAYSAMNTDWVVSEKNALHGVYRYAVAEGAGYDKFTDVEAVANLVQKLVGKKKIFIEDYHRNSDGGIYKLRPIQYSDIMIIFKNTTNMSDYVEKFAEKAIPVNVQGKFDINRDEVLKNFVLLVTYFADSKNKKNRITAAQIIKGFDATKANESVLQEAEKQLYQMKADFKEKRFGTAAIVQYLLEREDLYIPKGKAHAPERVRAYRIRLHQMVETCLAKNEGDLSSLAECMKEYFETKVKREIPLESNENAVQLMNVHQSKGLTGRIVIIADRSSNEVCKYSGFKKAGKYYPSVSYRSGYSNVIVPSFGHDSSIMEQAYKEEMEESIRLQYVAATRAAHAMIILPPTSSRNRNPWFSDKAYEYDSLRDINDWLAQREADMKEYPLEEKSTTDTHPVIKLSDLYENIAATDLSALEEVQMVSITPSGLEPAGVTGYNTSELGYKKENRPGANVFGTVMHRVFELVINRFEGLAELAIDEREQVIGRIINQAILEQAEEMRAVDKPEEFAAFLGPIMQSYFDKVLKPIIESAEEIYPEYTFSFFVPDTEREVFLGEFDFYCKNAKDPIEIISDKVWINGQADLVVKQKDGTVKVYDYKSDAMNGKPLPEFEESLAKKYSGQLALYRYAIGKSFGVEEVRTELIHLYRQ